MNTGHYGLQPFALRLEVVAHLVQEDQQHDPERELPAPDQRVAAEGDEDAAELREHEPNFARAIARGDQRRRTRA